MEKNEMMGLSTQEAIKLQEKYGKNELSAEKKKGLLSKIIDILREPMFSLLLVSAIIYFVLGEPRDGAIMLIFVIAIIFIETFQEWKTDKTLNALKNLSAPNVTVIRDQIEKSIASIDLVPGDVMLLSEGVKVPADGKILKANDLCIDESSLTGESVGVWKSAWSEKDSEEYWRRDYCYAGTLVTQGNAYVLVDKIGQATEYGKIGMHIAESPDRPTPLEKQVDKVVKVCTIIAGVLCLLAMTLTWFNIPDHMFKDRLIESILSGITLAMAMIPEEFPVILTVFLSMGAWRLAKKKSLIRRLPAVETLGSVSVLCVDKTGTITQNRMSVQQSWSIDDNEELLFETMGLACETQAYDPMEQAMLEFCEKQGITKEHLFESEFISEYSFTNETKMMGHIWCHEDKITIACKGSPESILSICSLTESMRNKIDEQIISMSKQGLRVIAVGIQYPEDRQAIPTDLMDCTLTFCGLIGLADPPRVGVDKDIERCLKAGIRLVMITGDNGITASAIAKLVGIPNSDHVCTGVEINEMTDSELRKRVQTTNIFSRVLPEHKMRIVKAFRENNEVVAMTGDGVNDAPALKYADIGIAMGDRGSEVSREAADMILLDDNFSTIVDTVKDGRRIYENIRKAIGYVFSIHIPIAFTALLAPLLKIAPDSLMLLPLHVVLLELVIDPTCSIVLERQPAEHDVMEVGPRNPKESILSLKVLTKSVVQGLAIFVFSFGLYYYSLHNGIEAEVSRTMGLCVIFLANLFLVQVNSSYMDSFFTSLKILAKDKVMWTVNFATLFGIGLILYSPLCSILKLSPLTLNQLLLTVFIAAVSVLWYEIIKWIKRRKVKQV